MTADQQNPYLNLRIHRKHNHDHLLPQLYNNAQVLENEVRNPLVII
jgi:hypothetical protein